MKRLPILFSLLALILLSASIAYWVLQLYKPAQRPLAPVTVAAQAEPAPDAAATLFGGQALAAVATSYQLTGVVVAGRDSAAILVADGQTPQAVKLGKEFASGVTVKEVHPKYVMLSEGGVLKRIELATDTKAGPGGLSIGGPAQPPAPPGNEMTGGGRPTGPVEPQQPPPPPQQPQMPPPTRVNQPPAE
jgi:general secretion pathway protein C